MTTALTSNEVSSRRLDCIESESLSGVIVPRPDGRQVNPTILYFSHGTSFSDGDIYRKVRKYQLENNDHAAIEWIRQLSRCKQVGLKQLLENKCLVAAFDALLGFPGLWIGLELGNIRRILAMHCDEEVIRYLGHVRLIWSRITLQKASLQRAVDVESVKSLQLRAPAVSIHDRDFVGTAMDSSMLFRSVIDPKTRIAIKDAIDKIPCIIPSIKTLHENSKTLGLGSKVLRELIVGKQLRVSLHETLLSYWRSPKDMVVEVAEGEFRHTEVSSREISWNLVYKQIWISALRYFPELTGIPPRKEKGGDTLNAEINLCRQHQFVLLVNHLGIGTSKTRAQLENNPHREALRHCITQILSPQCPSPKRQEDILDYMQQALPRNGEVYQNAVTCSTASHCSEVLERRWGRPFQNAHIAIQKQFFLPNIVSTVPPKSDSKPTALFVRRDFMDAFFGTTATLALSTTADPLPSWSIPSSSTIETEHDDSNGAEIVSDQDRMSIDLGNHENPSETNYADSVSTSPNLSRPSEYVPEDNSFESGVNLTSNQQTEVSNYDFPLSENPGLPTLNREFPTQIEQPRSPIKQHMESSPSGRISHAPSTIPDYASTSQTIVGEQSEQLVSVDQAATITHSPPFPFPRSVSLGPDHPRSPIAIGYQMTASELSPMIEAESSPLLDEGHEPDYTPTMQGYHNQLPLDQSDRYRRSPIASINQNTIVDISANPGPAVVVTAINESSQGLATKYFMTSPRGAHVNKDIELIAPALQHPSSAVGLLSHDINMRSAPPLQVMPSTDVSDTQVFDTVFDRPIGTPEASGLNVTFDKAVDMTDIFDSGKGTSHVSHNFISGKANSKRSYKFFFYNGMTLNSSVLTKDEMEKYLHKRPSSVMLAMSGNAGSNRSSKKQVWRTIPRRQIIAQMSAEPSLIYVLTVSEKAQWWTINGSHLLKEKKLHPARKYRYENPKVIETAKDEPVVAPNPWVHNHNSDSLNIFSETFYPAGRDLQTCEIDLISRRLELPSARAVLKYDEAKVCTLVTFDVTCIAQPCFQNYFQGYDAAHEESNLVENMPRGENSKGIIWMINSRAALSFKEERYMIPRAKFAAKRNVNVGGPLLGETDLFEDEDGEVERSTIPRVPHIEQLTADNRYARPTNNSAKAELIKSPDDGTKTAKKRGAEETEERSITMLLAMPSRLEIQESKRHLNETGWEKIKATCTSLEEEQLFHEEVIEL